MQSKSQSLDIVRGFAVAAVITNHYGLVFGLFKFLGFPAFLRVALSYGWMGVDLFFGLSAYLLTGSLLAAKARGEGANAILPFFVRRAFRILPLYTFVVAVAFAFKSFTQARGVPAPSVDTMAPLPVYLTFVQNFWQSGFSNWRGHFLSPTWSLAVEQQFYLLLPALVLFTTKDSARRFGFPLLFMLPALRVLVFAAYNDMTVYTNLATRADPFIWGVIIARAAREERPRLALLAGAAAAAALAVVIAGAVLTHYGNDYGYVLNQLAIYSLTGAGAALALLFATRERAAKATPASSGLAAIPRRVLQWCGERCYGLYLLQMPVAELVFQYARAGVASVHTGSDFILLCAALVLTAAATEILYVTIEAPLIRTGGALAAQLVRRGASIVPHRAGS
ncbi:MAG: acyltransferase [Hyphomicrobiales bacterium]|nr:acyltransferase [Hyphomicrobiales bacterium]